MDLIVDQAIRIKDGNYKGLYRVVALTQDECYLAVIETEFQGIRKRGPKPLNPSANPPKNTASFQLVILPLKTINALAQEYLLELVEMLLSNRALKSLSDDPSKNATHQHNISIMRDFLDTSKLVERVIKDQGFSGLVTNAARRNGIYSNKIYRLLKRLITHGFYENSLIPQYHNSGALGKERPFENGMKKCGAKSLIYRNAMKNNLELPQENPGMSNEWKKKCAIAIAKLPKPHPSIRKMYNLVLEAQFSPQLEMINGKITPLKIQKNSAPTYHQFKYFVKNHFSLLEHSKRITTPRNHNQNHRALLGNSYEGVAGPGHTYAIDSTMADIYLVSSLNRNIVVGRPVLYMIVDVWSGAIVGFFLCLSGPKWDMAKVALFTAIYDPEKMAALMGIPYQKVFKHQPGLCAVLLGDRGEYIAHQASITCFILKVDQEFTAPYRGDGKGIVEVHFRINKDGQINFVPGTHDARRIEMEQRQSKPDDATMTLHDYSAYVASEIRKYNLTADMSKRLNDYMKAEGVLSTPAGLWDWGHDVGIGFKKHISDDELIRTLLPKIDAKSTKNGIKANGRNYADLDNPIDRKMATIARNSGEREIDAWIYPGNIQSIWTNEGYESGLRTVERSGCDSSYVTEEEYQDSNCIAALAFQESAHSRTEIGVQELKLQKSVIDESIHLKKLDKLSKPDGNQKILDNREVENAYLMQHGANEIAHPELQELEVSDSNEDQYSAWLEKSLIGSSHE